MRNRGAFIAIVLLSLSTRACDAQGNSAASLLDAFANWKAVKIDVREQDKRNLPDSLHINGTSDVAGMSVDFICLTRTVDATIQPFGFGVFRGGAETAERFDVSIASKRESVQLHMLTLAEDHSSAIRLTSDMFERVLGMFSEDEDVSVSFETKFGRAIVAHVRGSRRLFSIRRSCEQMTS